MARLFFSYSHIDEDLRNELEKHLAMLKRQGLIEPWHDRRIDAGDEFDKEISEKLETADIVLLLVSASFLASDYCFDKEMARALERNAEGTARVIPVILHPCDWHGDPFGNLLATPPDGKAVSLYANQDEALALVAKAIRGAAEVRDRPVTPSSQAQDVVSVETIDAKDPLRSSNLGVKRHFSDQETDEFIESSFEYIARFFEGSLAELQQRNKNISTKFKRVDANRFTASIYNQGATASECTIWTGSDNLFSDGIAYYAGITDSSGSLNDSLSVGNDGYSLHLEPMGMSRIGRELPGELSQEGAAEYLWELLIERLQ